MPPQINKLAVQRVCWVITDGSIGMENQAWGLAESLGYTVIVKRLTIKQPWLFFAPHIRLFLKWAHKSVDLSKQKYQFNVCEDSKISPPWPDLVVACGRRSILIALHIKQQSIKCQKNKHQKSLTKILYLQDPKISSKHFDVVVCPQHDKIDGPNVIKMLGAPHRLTTSKLELAKKSFKDILKNYKGPYFGVLLGGHSRAFKFDEVATFELCKMLSTIQAQHGATLLITPSRRTPPETITLIKNYFTTNNVYIWDAQSENPYLAILGVSDCLFVSCDSVSMISEACFSNKTVRLLGLPGGNAKFRAFYKSLFDRQRIAWASASEIINYKQTFPPLNELPKILENIKKLLK